MGQIKNIKLHIVTDIKVYIWKRVNMSFDEQERKLFIGGLNKQNTDEDALKSYFSSYGTIIDCTIMRDHDRVSRGFGFILFEDSASIDRIMTAKKEGAQFTLDDHHVEIKRALPKVANGGNVGSSRSGGMNRKVFVGGLPSSITEQELRDYFESYGRVNEVELLREKDSGRLRGFAFVTFDEEDSAEKCMQRRQHEICKKICEVKRAAPRAKLEDRDRDRDRDSSNGYRGRSSGFDRGDRPQQSSNSPQLPFAASSGMSMVEVNQMIQQAFIMGQQSVQGTMMGVPTVSSLLNGGTAAAPAMNNNNILLQALMNQQAAPAPVPAPAPAPQTNNNSQLTQLAQLLQGRGIDANSLAGILGGKQETAAAPSPPTPEKTATGYSTAYPSLSTYDYGYKTTNYGPAKDDGKRGYRPY